MMDVLKLIIVAGMGVGVLSVAAWLVVSGLRDAERMREYLEDEKRAFDEAIQIRPLNKAQILRLAPLVDEVAILRLPDERDHRGRHDPARDQFHVFLVDTEGAVHDIVKTKDRQEAIELAVRIAQGMDVELVDREKIAS
jgi:hypothetical protein